MDEGESKAVHISDLFGNARFMEQRGRTLDERASLLKFFVDELGKPARVLGIRLRHYKIADLYALQSCFKDRLRRPCGPCLSGGATGACAHSRDTAAKYFWYMTRTQIV